MAPGPSWGKGRFRSDKSSDAASIDAWCRTWSRTIRVAYPLQAMLQPEPLAEVTSFGDVLRRCVGC